ncbi:hypothetical protein KUCAC02_013044, partial [Chaenocephalus aceratus]
SSVSRSALNSWKPPSCSAKSGINPHSQVSVKHKTQDEEKPLFLLTTNPHSLESSISDYSSPHGTQSPTGRE